MSFFFFKFNIFSCFPDIEFCCVLQKLSLVNGVLFTGGWAKSGLYFDVVGTVFKVNDFLSSMKTCYLFCV